MHALAQYPKAEKKPRYSPKPAFAYAYTPASSSGLRTASVWNTNASISIPVPATAHAISAPNTPVARAKFRGSEKTPAPTIDPTTMAISVVSGNFRTSAGAFASTVVTRPPPAAPGPPHHRRGRPSWVGKVTASRADRDNQPRVNAAGGTGRITASASAGARGPPDFPALIRPPGVRFGSAHGAPPVPCGPGPPGRNLSTLAPTRNG